MTVEQVTRLAPSPTGALHLGNARTLLVNFLLAMKLGWRVVMRMEDLDGPRIKPGAAGQVLDELAWIGLEWDEPVTYQSGRAAAYRAALDKLIASGDAYPCTCSRKDIELAGSAPHLDDPVRTYPGTCRRRWRSAEQAMQAAHRPVAWRVMVPDRAISFEDRFAGSWSFRLTETCGAFVIFRSEGMAGYQLAVVVDDAAAGVNRIVRGDDLLDSTARQIHLRRLLGLDWPVEYWHLPLIVGPDGRRLAKRHGDTRLARYRRAGVPAGRLLGLLGYWSGLIETRRPATMAELLDRFDPGLIPPRQIVFAPADNAFLLGG